jgi:hypothetical protein
VNNWIAPKPTQYAGHLFRSQLEAHWASALDHYGIRWEYEPVCLELPSGSGYEPDFWLPDLDTVIEVKGAHMQRTGKTIELAREVAPDWIVLFGWSPQWCTEPGKPQSFMKWLDAAGYQLHFGQCQCGAWQWFRVRVSLQCRICKQPLGSGVHLFRPDEELEFGGGKDAMFELPSIVRQTAQRATLARVLPLWPAAVDRPAERARRRA